ncbi:MAG: LysR family transcriptional regulator, partial [Burkholderiaceae bacterium]|nr:LysR family transcriptional regulator [Burkholderiaceae bacterium]
MNITFRQMRLFLALADTGSVSGAARALHVTQPTASMQLREVTEAVGLPLYEVIGRRVHLTDAGRDLAATARAIVDAWEN